MAQQEDSPIMLSTFATLSVNSAKHLAAQHDRPSLRLRVTIGGAASVDAYWVTIKVTPTDHPASGLSSWRRVMRIG